MMLNEKRKQRVCFKPGISWSPDWRLRKHGHAGFTYFTAIFDKVIQFLLHSKVAKAESYLIGGYHNEWLELTYYIETLVGQMFADTKVFVLNSLEPKKDCQIPN